jgi:hypothetical protein
MIRDRGKIEPDFFRPFGIFNELFGTVLLRHQLVAKLKHLRLLRDRIPGD